MTTSHKQRLELTWIGKENRPRLEPRILIEEPENSYHAAHRVTDEDIFDNRLIFGDNLLALKALEAEFAGQVKCAYIDPPFNTGQAFEHYDDTVEHSIWLSLIRDRLFCIRTVLSEDGTIFVHIDDTELGYLIVLMDEVFGRTNRISVITFKQGAATGHKSINPGVVTTSNFLLMYAKNKANWAPNRVFRARDERDRRYGQFILNREDNYAGWKFTALTTAFARNIGLPEQGLRQSLGEGFETRISEFVMTHADCVIRFARPDYGAVSAAAREMIDGSREHPAAVLKLGRVGMSDMYFRGGERILFYSDKLKLVDGEYVAGEPLTSIWDDILSNNLHNEGGIAFPKGKKPEALVKRCLDLTTVRGDLVLDSFAGSGTTGAVAHKMGRRWIMVELGDHCHTHIIPRLRKVIDGADPSGITNAADWKGGGGFRYHRLAPSLLEKDRWGQWVISTEFDRNMLVEAVCKLEGFGYAPSETEWWQHGSSTERDFIYVTTATLSDEQLVQLSEEVGTERTLLVMCSAFRSRVDGYPNLTVKKIPTAVLSCCEWGHDDYSLLVENLPKAPQKPRQPALFDGTGL